MHHAYFLEGSREAGLKFVNKFCEEKLGVKTAKLTVTAAGGTADFNF